MFVPLRIFVVVAAGVFAATAPAAAQSTRKTDRALDQVIAHGHHSDRTHRIIVRARPGSIGSLRARIPRGGPQITAEHPAIEAFTLQIAARDIARFCASAEVESCSDDAVVAATASVARSEDPSRTAGLHVANSMLDNIGAAGLSTTGRGVTVALIDSGLQPSKAFAGRIKAFFDFTDGQARFERRSSDDYGHGTHVAGLIGGAQARSDRDYQGVATGVEFVVLKVLDRNGTGQTSDVIRAIEFATANAGDAALGIDIINLSLGHPIFEDAATDPLVQAVEAATRAGVIVVTSAGNFGTNPSTGDIGYAGTTSPGNAPSAITVGAYDHKATANRADDRVTVYSSRGPTWLDGFAKPDLVAPGHLLGGEAFRYGALYRAYPALHRSGESGRSFLALSGTSMAAAVTTGVVALMKERGDAWLTPNLAKGILQFTAIPLNDDAGSRYDILTQGTGGINAAGAVALITSIDFGLADRPGKWTTAASCPVGSDTGRENSLCSTSIDGTNYDWARSIVWGQNIVWGDTVHYNLPTWNLLTYTQRDGSVFGGNIVWGDNIVWADGTTWGGLFPHAHNIVWADNVVWADNIVWGENIVWGDNIVWADREVMSSDRDNIVWGNNIVWGENVLWGESLEDNIVWGNWENIVWGEFDDNIVWGNGLDLRPASGGRR
jgi:serine protease AprX